MVARAPIAVVLAVLALGVWMGTRPAPPAAPGPVVHADSVAVTRDGPVVLVDGAPFTGRLVTAAPDGGRVEAAYRGGRRHGDQRTWDAAGTLREHRTYAAGRREGTHRGWHADGAPAFVASFSADRLDGTLRTWYPGGQIAREHHYADGHEAGRQRAWTAAGALSANYIVADGRRYGLLGAKPCSTP